MKENWQYKKLIDVCDFQYGYPFESSLFSSSSEDGMPLVRIRDVKNGFSETFYKGNYPQEYIVKRGDYLIGMDGEFNISAWKSEDALLNQRVCKISPKDSNINIKFIYRFLSKELKSIEDETPFVTVKHLSAKRINQICINVPPKDEQERIVGELDLLSGVMEKQRQQLKELDTLAQSIFYSMFGDPVTNDKGWPIKKLNTLISEKLSYGSGASGLVFDGKIRYIRITDIDDFGKLKPEIAASPSIYDEKYLLEEGDILFARSGATVGKTFLYTNEIGKAIYAGYLIRARLNKTLLQPLYLFYLTKTQYYRDYINRLNRGVAQPNINARLYGEFFIPVPPLSLQNEFAEKIEKIEKQKEAIAKSIEDTQKLFDYTMDKYFGS